eukprot:4103685-Pyramimonas_sp.AAC.1
MSQRRCSRRDDDGCGADYGDNGALANEGDDTKDRHDESADYDDDRDVEADFADEDDDEDNDEDAAAGDCNGGGDCA